jgi:hypothetical protein
MSETVAVASGCHAHVSDATSLAGAQIAERINTTSHAPRSPVDRLVTERVGQTLHGMS